MHYVDHLEAMLRDTNKTFTRGGDYKTTLFYIDDFIIEVFSSHVCISKGAFWHGGPCCDEMLSYIWDTIMK